MPSVEFLFLYDSTLCRKLLLLSETIKKASLPSAVATRQYLTGLSYADCAAQYSKMQKGVLQKGVLDSSIIYCILSYSPKQCPPSLFGNIQNAETRFLRITVIFERGGCHSVIKKISLSP
jgi:hypothetical protein